MAPITKPLDGKWRTDGVQFGWPPPGPSGAWRGNLTLGKNGNTHMDFTWGNIAPTRNGHWKLNGSTLTITDTERTVWTATVSSDGRQMSGNYDSGPPGANDGTWSAQKVSGK